MRPVLCKEHERIRSAWVKFRYSTLHPKDWPGQMILDARTSHEDRRKEWDRKNAEQVALTEEICLSGKSPQCTGNGERL
jgi:hypothetical protein